MKTRKETLRRIRAKLEKRRDSLRRLLAIGELELRTPANDVGDTVDAALDAEYLELQSQLATVESRELAGIENALLRIVSKQYGTCEVCEKEISLARLESLPYATQCIQCQRTSEGRQGNRLRNVNWRSFYEPSMDADLSMLEVAEVTAY